MNKKRVNVMLAMILSLCLVTPALGQTADQDDTETVSIESIRHETEERIIIDSVAAYGELMDNELQPMASSSWGSGDLKFGDVLSNDTEKRMYDFLDENVENCDVLSYTLDLGSDKPRHSTVENGIDRVRLAFESDHPELFWADDFTFRIEKEGVLAKKVTFNFKSMYYTNYNLQKNKTNNLKNKINSIISDMNSLNIIDDDDKFAYLYTWILNNNTYNSSALANGVGNRDNYPDAFTAYGAIMQGSSVCQGYSMGLQALCDAAGIDCITVNGNKNSGKHSWNYVKLGSRWYFVDATNSDGRTYQYKYFLRAMPSVYSVNMKLATPTPYNGYYREFGDVDNWVGLTANDAAMVYQAVLIKGAPMVEFLGDVNADGSLTAEDASQILQKTNNSYSIVFNAYNVTSGN